VIRPGDIQRMSAGTGVTHSEFNSSRAELVHLLQIWILPETRGLPPGYEQQAFPDTERRARLRLIGSRDGHERSVTIHQDVALYATLLAAGEEVAHVLRPGRHAWVQVARGTVALNGHPLKDGDGAAVSDEARVELRARTPSELLVFDLA
jgi:redox-sensitive bicupin YhaK (pirin superfamily)